MRLHPVHVLVLASLLIAAPARADDWGARVVEAAQAAALDPASWGPALGALALRPLDHELRDWSQREQPLFDEREAADRWSDGLRDALVVAAIGTTLALPDAERERWSEGRAERALTAAGAYGLAFATTGALKSSAGRTRPDASDTRSFSSGHASAAFVSASLIDDHLARAGEPTAWHAGARALAYGSAALTAWARVEADEHWTSDVLAGAAIGNFFARFATQLAGRSGHAVQVGMELRPDAARLSLAWPLSPN